MTGVLEVMRGLILAVGVSNYSSKTDVRQEEGGVRGTREGSRGRMVSQSVFA